MPEFASWFSAAALPAVLFLYLFWHADDVVHPGLRERLAHFLLDTQAHSISRDYTPIFARLFDATFGPNPWSTTFLYRSVRISIVAFAIMLAVYFTKNDVSFDYIRTHAYNILLLGLLVNLIPDYISLVESRFIFRCMRDKTRMGVVLLLLLDFVATSVIISLSFLVLIGYYRGDYFSAIGAMPNVLWKGVTLTKPEGVAIYTTYISSVWVWLYLISVLLVRTRGVRWLLHNVLNAESYPFRSLGVVMFIPLFLVCVVGRQVWRWITIVLS